MADRRQEHDTDHQIGDEPEELGKTKRHKREPYDHQDEEDHRHREEQTATEEDESLGVLGNAEFVGDPTTGADSDLAQHGAEGTARLGLAPAIVVGPGIAGELSSLKPIAAVAVMDPSIGSRQLDLRMMTAVDIPPELRDDLLRYLFATSAERTRIIGELAERAGGWQPADHIFYLLGEVPEIGKEMRAPRSNSGSRRTVDASEIVSTGEA